MPILFFYKSRWAKQAGCTCYLAYWARLGISKYRVGVGVLIWWDIRVALTKFSGVRSREFFNYLYRHLVMKTFAKKLTSLMLSALSLKAFTGASPGPRRYTPVQSYTGLPEHVECFRIGRRLYFSLFILNLIPPPNWDDSTLYQKLPDLSGG